MSPTRAWASYEPSLGDANAFAELISLAFFALFVVGAVVAPRESPGRARAIAIGLAGILAAAVLPLLGALPAVGVVRDLIPVLFLLMVYWQSGQLFRGGDPRLEALLLEMEERWFPYVGRITSSVDRCRGLSACLEAAYFLCYPMVPLGIVLLYLTDRSDAADQLWRVVLPPTYACYVLTALFQSRPPRLVEGERATAGSRSALRSVNLWLLGHVGTRANTVPSGHVASSLAIALVFLTVMPSVGVVLLFVAASIAAATVVLRYHYATDAVLGVALAVLSFAVLG